MIDAVSSSDSTLIGEGTVAAGYQNFLICVEMFFAAIAMHFAFPHRRYSTSNDRSGTRSGTGSSLQSISSNLKEAVNPRDIVADAVYNFHPQYQQYTRHNGGLPKDELEAYYRHTAAVAADAAAASIVSAHQAAIINSSGRYQEQTLVVPSSGVGTAINPAGGSGLARPVDSYNPGSIMPGLEPIPTRSKLTEKAVLLPTSSELA